MNENRVMSLVKYVAKVILRFDLVILAESRHPNSMDFLTRHRLFLIALVLTLFLGGLVAALTLAPVSAASVPGSDKLHHVLGFAALSFPLPFARPKLALPIVLGVAAYGGLIELIQPYVGRQAEWGDFLADVSGAIMGASLGALCSRWLGRKMVRLGNATVRLGS